jgi:hypothetical protein
MAINAASAVSLAGHYNQLTPALIRISAQAS